MENSNKNFDQNLYSRQAAVYGESMGKLIKMRVYLYGIGGVGIEIAKNVVLAGPASLTIQDGQLATMNDLASNFYLSEKDIGKKRVQCVYEQVQELNHYVKVSTIATEDINTSLEFYKQFDVVVFTDVYNLKALLEINNLCRTNNIGFILGGTMGVYGYVFTDFGDNYKNFDKDGEQNRQCIVTNITQDSQGGIVTVHEDKKHLFQDGDYVQFREVQGMTQVNSQTYPILILSPLSFRIQQDTNLFNPYTREGVVEQIKVQSHVKFRSLQDSLKVPIAVDAKPQDKDMINPDMLNFGRAEQLHIILQAVYQFSAINNRFILPHNHQDVQQLIQIANQLNSNITLQPDICKVDSIDQQVLINMVRFGQAQISPVTSFFGAIISQEIIKHTGKFMPIRQWMHTDFFKVLPDLDFQFQSQSQVIRNLPNNRYNDVVTIFGNEVAEKLQKQKLFMIGAGALGCEFLKMFALTGMGLKSNEGAVIVTDDDNIEISNLNRQFLFRKQNVGGSKSMIATEASRQMNPQINSKGVKLRTCTDTEEYFNDSFWEELSFVVNAVDNVQARLYVDSRCVFYQKALFESGTLGTKCNSQVILPKLTQSYGETPDPKEEEFAICTLKNFPYLIEHTIQWGRDLFEGIFVEAPNSLKQFIINPQSFIETLIKQNNNKFNIIRSKLETVQELIGIVNDYDNRHKNIVQFSRMLFEDSFNNQIAELQSNFPENHLTDENQLFWSGPKRYPSRCIFNCCDILHILFIISCSNILMNVLFNEPNSISQQLAIQLANETPVSEYVPKKLKISKEKNNTELISDEDEEITNKLIKEMGQFNNQQIKQVFNLQEFEKDDDSNFHIDFITATSNLRARNYRINEVDRLKVKLTAGKIIPAIATTTAMVCGVSTLEMIKYVQGKGIDEFKNSFMNLAVNLFLFTDPLPPNQQQDKDYDPIMMGPVKAIPKNWTVWDKIYLSDCHLLKDVIQQMKDKYQVNLSIIGLGKATIYNTYGNQQEMKARLEMNIKDLYKKITGIEYPPHKKYIEIEVSGDLDDGSDTLLPSVVLKLT